MKYEGNVIVKYKDNKSIILNVPGEGSYMAGELMCKLAQGESLHHLVIKARQVPWIFSTLQDPMPITQETVDEAERTLINFLLDWKEEEPLAVHLAAGIFFKVIEKHRTLISRDRKSVEKYIVNRILDFASDQRATYICGSYVNELDYDARAVEIRRLIHLHHLGGLMMLCYAEYISDIIDGFTFFESAVAVDAGIATKEDRARTERLINELETSEHIHGAEAMIMYDRESGTHSFSYRFTSLLTLEAFEYVQMKTAGAKIKKCQNPECGKFFVAQRNTAMYCPYPSPQDPARSCKKYYPQILYKKNKDLDEGYRIYRRTMSKLMKRRENKPWEYDVHDAAIVELRDTYNNKYKPALKNGEINIKVFKSWIEKF